MNDEKETSPLLFDRAHHRASTALTAASVFYVSVCLATMGGLLIVLA